MGSEDALLGGTRRSTGSKEHTSTWAPFVGGELLQGLFVAFSTKRNAASPSFHSAKDRRKIRHSLHLVLRVRKHIFPDFRIFRSRWCEAFAPQTAKHFSNEEIMPKRATRWNSPLSWVSSVYGPHLHMGSKDAPLGGTRRSAGSKDHTSTWAPFVGTWTPL